MRELATPVPSAVHPVRWSVAALTLAGIGVIASAWLVVGSDGDPSGVRWWLVVAPIAICLVPVVAPRRETRIGAVAAQALWCGLAALSIGVFLLPALGALFVAMLREGR